MNIKQFSENYLPQVSELLAQRHQRERQQNTQLPPEAENGAIAQQAIEEILQKPRAGGVIAENNGEVLAYLIGYEDVSEIMRRTGWIPIAGHATKVGYEYLYQELYTELAKRWVKNGCFSHFVLASAYSPATLETWFSLNFGKQQVYAMLNLESYQTPEKLLENIVVRQAEKSDKEILVSFHDLIARYQMLSPVFAPSPPEYIAELRKGFEELVDDDEAIVWLAEFKGEVVGYQVYYEAERKAHNLITPSNACELAVSGTLPDVRSQGIGKAITHHGLTHMKNRGYTTCLIDWRTTNILASRFWQKMGFEPLVYRLNRLIDERVAWANQ